MTRPPHAASSVVGYASDTASVVAKVEPNSNRSRETGQPYYYWAGPVTMATTGDFWIIPSFRIWGYVLHAEHISCVITNCGQHQWAIPSLFSIALYALLEENITRKLLSLSLDFLFKTLLFEVAFLVFFSIAVFSPCVLLLGFVIAVCGYISVRELQVLL